MSTYFFSASIQKNQIIVYSYIGDKNYCENIEEKFNVDFIELDSNETHNFKNYKITAFELKHGDCTPMYGYLLRKDNIIIGYTGDTGICDNFITMCEQVNYMFVEATTIEL